MQGVGLKLNYIPVEADFKPSILLAMSEIAIIVLLSLFLMLDALIQPSCAQLSQPMIGE
jgi:hypothetical protein